uniref:Magnetosome protein MamK n=1 Tax=Candidatus Magnetananas rongchengensis TaxID=1463558 RepID=A0A3S6J0V6_9BACT|nr:magnetosome protein MamK [Candidatus Magnetananas rongchenensis]
MSKIINIGIDLGTSRSVIACDNGIRSYTASYVGYPKDAVSEKMLGKDIVFGEECLKNRLALNLYRPFSNGVLKHSDSADKNPKEYSKAKDVARELMKHLTDLATAEEETDDLILRGVIGAPALATKNNKKDLLAIAEGILDDVMIASEPFTVAYGMDLFSNALIIDIGAGTVDLCRMHGTIPTDEDQITTFKAGDYVDQVFLNLVKEKHKNANFTLTMIKKFKEENSFLTKHGEKVTINLPVKGKPTPHDVTDELRQACRSIVPEIVEGVKQLVASFDPEFQDNLKQNVILAGGGSQIVGLKNEIESYMMENLGYGKVVKVEEPLYAGANGALLLCKDMPDEYWDDLKKRD